MLPNLDYSLERSEVLRRSITTLLLAQAFLLVVANCCCWLPADTMACDVATEKSACCCETQGHITSEPPSLAATLLLHVPSLQGPGASDGLHLPGKSLDISSPYPQIPVLASPSQHSAPPLYLLNASILV